MKFQTVTVVGQSAAHEGREEARTREKGVLFGENKRRHYRQVHTASYPLRSLHHTQQSFQVTSNYFSSHRKSRADRREGAPHNGWLDLCCSQASTEAHIGLTGASRGAHYGKGSAIFSAQNRAPSSRTVNRGLGFSSPAQKFPQSLYTRIKGWHYMKRVGAPLRTFVLVEVFPSPILHTTTGHIGNYHDCKSQRVRTQSPPQRPMHSALFTQCSSELPVESLSSYLGIYAQIYRNVGSQNSRQKKVVDPALSNTYL